MLCLIYYVGLNNGRKLLKSNTLFFLILLYYYTLVKTVQVKMAQYYVQSYLQFIMISFFCSDEFSLHCCADFVYSSTVYVIDNEFGGLS